jgi:hypothetical protein
MLIFKVVIFKLDNVPVLFSMPQLISEFIDVPLRIHTFQVHPGSFERFEIVQG